MLLLCERLERFSHLKSEISDLKSLAESISRQLRAWADHLQNSPIAGQRHLTDAVRSQDERKKRMVAFDAELDRVRREAGASGLLSALAPLSLEFVYLHADQELVTHLEERIDEARRPVKKAQIHKVHIRESHRRPQRERQPLEYALAGLHRRTVLQRRGALLGRKILRV